MGIDREVASGTSTFKGQAQRDATAIRHLGIHYLLTPGHNVPGLWFRSQDMQRTHSG